MKAMRNPLVAATLVVASAVLFAQAPTNFADVATWLQKYVKPLTPDTPSPATAATNVALPVTLSWRSLGATKSTVYFSKCPAPATWNPVSSNQTAFTYAPAGLAANTQYCWKVISSDGAGASPASPVWTFTTASGSGGGGGTGTLTPIAQSNIVPLGGFVLPQDSAYGDPNGVGFTQMTIPGMAAVDDTACLSGVGLYVGTQPPGGGSVDNKTRFAEVCVPLTTTLNNGTDLTMYPVATVVQNFAVADEGKVDALLGATSCLGGPWPVSSVTVVGSRLYGTADCFYDTNTAGQTPGAWFSRPLNLSTTGQVLGPYTLTDSQDAPNMVFPESAMGHLWSVPPVWQAALGGDIAGVKTGDSVETSQSWGPAMFVGSTSKFTGAAGAAIPVLGFFEDQAHAVSGIAGTGLGYDPRDVSNGVVQGFAGNTNGSLYLWWSSVSGQTAVIPSNHSSLLYFGMTGAAGVDPKGLTNRYAYGCGSDDPALLNGPFPSPTSHGACDLSACSDDGKVCHYAYDPPTGATKGNHDWPYAYQWLTYDLNQVAACIAGTLDCQSLYYQTRWVHTFPIMPDQTVTGLGGEGSLTPTIDSKNRVYVGEGTTNGTPGCCYSSVIYVYQVN